MTLPVPAQTLPLDEIEALAERQRRAGRGLIAILNGIGGGLENKAKLLPAPVRRAIEAATAAVLRNAYGVAGRGARLGLPGGRMPTVLAGVSGAVGGFAGLPGAIVELPVTITLILRAIQDVAAEHGFDPDDEGTRREVLRVFASGGLLDDDDGIDTSFIGARVAISGAALNGLIAKVAPKLAATLSQKLAAQAVPVLGAASGAALNLAFINHYRELAQIRFSLLRLAMEHDPGAVSSAFVGAVAGAPRLIDKG